MSDAIQTPDRRLDLNYLALVARGLDEANHVPKRRTTAQSTIEETLVRRQAAVLDSLAWISVSQAQKQVVAFGAQLRSDSVGGVIILVAENGPPVAGLVPHVRDMFARLQKIYEHRPPAPEGKRSWRIPPYIPADSASTFDSELVDLELTILKYSWDKLRQRVTKNTRHKNFIETVNDICGPPANERATDRDEAERRHLAFLQNHPGVNPEEIRSMALRIEGLAAVLNHGATDEHAKSVRSFLHSLLVGRRRLTSIVEHEAVFHAWNTYTRLRLEKAPVRLEKGNKVRKDPDTFHWLDKVVSIREHYLCIADVVTSRTLSGLLQGIRVEAVRNPVPPSTPISLSRAEMKYILTDAGHDVESLQDEAIEEFLHALAKAHTVEFTEDKLVIEHPTPTHCECRVLAAIHNTPAIPYIGVSKLSCAFCDLYFATYRDVTKSRICTRGVHSQTAPWACPSLVGDPSVDSKVRKKLCSEIFNKISIGWSLYSQSHGRASLASQSTAASGKEDRWTRYGDLLDDAVDEEKYFP
ncbi:hypothetical protein B0H11DRAFT_1152710 [Mycena galericulata]|nr:hypothetical protein B0H11DRAFT_1152710 [Mycena galericulata]